MSENKHSFGTQFKTVIWAVKLALQFNAPTYILLNISTIVQDNIIIISTFLAAVLLDRVAQGIIGFTPDVIILLALTFITAFLSSYTYDITSYLTTKFNQYWELKAWEVFLDKTSKLDFQHLESSEYNLLMHKVQEAVNWRGRIVALTVPELLSALVGIVLTIGIFFSLNPIFIFLILVPEIIRFFINRKFGYDLFSIWDSHGETKTHAWHAQHSFEKPDVIREAKIYAFSNTILNRYRTEISKFMDESLKKLNRRYLLVGVTTLLDVIVLIGIQIWLITQVIAKSINLGAYTFYLANINTASNAFNRVQISFSSIFENIPYVIDFRRYLELEDLVIKPKNPIYLEQKAPKIEFKNVSFSYPKSNKKVLDNVSFVINPGEKVALVGENGAGKTTLIKLLARFYDVTEGEILVNDINIKKIELTSYYKLWGVLFQSFAKLWLSVRENIGLGNVEDMNNMELIEQAADKADAEKFISKLPKKYETLLSKDFKNGTDLSGGQWQKLGIARAVFADPKLIVLDEPTSALDSLAESEVFKNINEISKESTIVVISHRFATVRNANRILVLKDGALLEQGTHEELLENNQLYSEMFKEQAKGYK